MTMTLRRAVFSLVLAVCCGVPALAEVAPEVERRLRLMMDERTREADRLFEASGREYVGTGWNEVHAFIHRCHVLSMILGKDHLTPQLVPEPINEISGTYSQSVTSNSLNNWVLQASTALGQTPTQRVRTWNLDCVGEFGITDEDAIGEAVPTAEVAVEGETIRVLGNVERGFFDTLKAAIDNNPQSTTVALGSAGGALIEAMQAGAYIRRQGLRTVLYNECRSACAFVFLGGVQRAVWSPYPKLGFHKVAARGSAVADDHPIYERVADYAAAMRVDPGFVLGAMRSAGIRDMAYPEMDALCQANVVTWVQRLCFGDDYKSFEPGRHPEPVALPDVASRGALGAGQDQRQTVAMGGPIPRPNPARRPSTAVTAADAFDPAALPEGVGGEAYCANLSQMRRTVVEEDPQMVAQLDAMGIPFDKAGMLAMFDQMAAQAGC